MVLLATHLDLRAALTVVAAALVIGIGLGALAGFVKRLDEPLMRITDVFLSIPSLVLAMAIAVGAGARSIENLSIALVFVSWPIYCRLMRGQVLSEKEKPYVRALRTPGGGAGPHDRPAHHPEHGVPGGRARPRRRRPDPDHAGCAELHRLRARALRARVGQPGRAGQAYIFQAPWLVIFPGAAIFLTSLSLNLVGDWARDVFDPRLRS